MGPGYKFSYPTPETGNPSPKLEVGLLEYPLLAPQATCTPDRNVTRKRAYRAGDSC